MRRTSLCAILLVLSIPASVDAATIHGRIYTAGHEDSLARRLPVGLIFKDAEEQAQRQETVTDDTGHFHFHGLSPDTAIGYVLRVAFRGREFLGAPLHFAPGQESIEVPRLLIAASPAAAAPPPDHAAAGRPVAVGRPASQSPIHMLLIVLWIVLIFAGLAALTRPSTAPTQGVRLNSSARALIRDIASLDNRFEDGDLGEEEYRKVRGGLVQRLRALLQTDAAR